MEEPDITEEIVIGHTRLTLVLKTSLADLCQEGLVMITAPDAWPLGPRNRTYADRRAARIDADRLIGRLLGYATAHARLEFLASEAGKAWHLRSTSRSR